MAGSLGHLGPARCPDGGRQQLVLTDGCRSGTAALMDDRSGRDPGAWGWCPLAQSVELHPQSIEAVILRPT